MKSNRRNFLKLSGLAGIGLASTNILDGQAALLRQLGAHSVRQGGKHFNMSGYAAPKIETVRIGFIGLGNRGPGAVSRMSKIDGVDIKALCDIRPDKANKVKEIAGQHQLINRMYTAAVKMNGKKFATERISTLIYIATPWKLHTPMAVYAMEHGKHAASEVPAAVTVDECWQLVRNL